MGEFAGCSCNPEVITMYLIKSEYKLDKVRLEYIWEQLGHGSFNGFPYVYREMRKWIDRDEWEWKTNKLSDSLKDKIDYILSKDDVTLKVDWL